jgi:hypothetical protein
MNDKTEFFCLYNVKTEELNQINILKQPISFVQVAYE